MEIPIDILWLFNARVIYASCLIHLRIGAKTVLRVCVRIGFVAFSQIDRKCTWDEPDGCHN